MKQRNEDGTLFLGGNDSLQTDSIAGVGVATIADVKRDKLAGLKFYRFLVLHLFDSFLIYNHRFL